MARLQRLHFLRSRCPHQTFTSGENYGFFEKLKKGKGKPLTQKYFPAPEGVIGLLGICF